VVFIFAWAAGSDSTDAVGAGLINAIYVIILGVNKVFNPSCGWFYFYGFSFGQ